MQAISMVNFPDVVVVPASRIRCSHLFVCVFVLDIMTCQHSVFSVRCLTELGVIMNELGAPIFDYTCMFACSSK